MSEEPEAHIVAAVGMYLAGDPEPVADYLNDLEALVLLTPLSYKAKQRFLELIDKLRAQLQHLERSPIGETK